MSLLAICFVHCCNNHGLNFTLAFLNQLNSFNMLGYSEVTQGIVFEPLPSLAFCNAFHIIPSWCMLIEISVCLSMCCQTTWFFYQSDAFLTFAFMSALKKVKKYEHCRTHSRFSILMYVIEHPHYNLLAIIHTNNMLKRILRFLY